MNAAETRLCLKTLDFEVATVARPWASNVLSQFTHALASVATSFKGLQTKPSPRHLSDELFRPARLPVELELSMSAEGDGGGHGGPRG